MPRTPIRIRSHIDLEQILLDNIAWLSAKMRSQTPKLTPEERAHVALILSQAIATLNSAWLDVHRRFYKKTGDE